MIPDKVRLAFRFSAEATKQFDRFCIREGSLQPHELVRRALAAYEDAIDEGQSVEAWKTTALERWLDKVDDLVGQALLGEEPPPQRPEPLPAGGMTLVFNFSRDGYDRLEEFRQGRSLPNLGAVLHEALGFYAYQRNFEL